MESIINRNDKCKLHGYQEFYFHGKLYLKCFFYNGKLDDYEERYCYGGGELKNKTFYI
jgi:hypothetical protein